MAGRGNKFSKLKYEEKIRDEINLALRREFADPRLSFISVTRVELSDDYSHAKVWWDTYDSAKRGDAKAAIEGIRGKMRTHLSSKMEVRHVPELHFAYDSQYDDENHITGLLKGEDLGEEE